jgi:hypothetical protein
VTALDRGNVSAESRDRRLTPQLDSFLAVCVGLGLAFQIGHFFEHFFQWAVWLSGNYQWVNSTFCGRDTPFMSPPAAEAVRLMGEYLFPASSVSRQMMMGMEILHLIGNGIFLATIAGVFYFIPSKWVRYAFYIEGAHMCEHIALTLSAYYLGKPIGLSTMFGQAPIWWGKEAAVGWRVSFHFFMNLFPMPFVAFAMMQRWSAITGGRSETLDAKLV